MADKGPDPVEKLPSIVDASPKEEDYFFTSLGLEDGSGSDVDVYAGQDGSGTAGIKSSSDLLQPRNRKERMKAAYEESKRLYKAEHGYTESGWYIGLDKHPYEYTSSVVSSGSGNIHLNNGQPVEVDQKMIGKLHSTAPDANVVYEFYAGNYRKSLNVLLGRTENDDTPPPSASPTSKAETEMKNKIDKLSREMFDCGMCTCVKLDDAEWAGYLADASRKYWSMPGHAGLAESASRAYHTAQRSNDSIISLLYAIADRGALYAYLIAAQQTLRVCHTSGSSPTAPHAPDPSHDPSALFARFLHLVEWVIDSVPASYAQPLFAEVPDAAAGLQQKETKEQRTPPASVTTSEAYMRFGEELTDTLCLTGKDLETCRKAWKKMGQLISTRLRAGNVDAPEAEEGETTKLGRSVRSL
ncbi:hypothetical protein QFC22_000278 [Naganishia vaughanmartiniae]|uniref:Uncharacterized protein n=1 Tax=Naganishia vaughanmartiniae TaxID=1424756 RepID=A0ACC2XQN2_9TREE|nr:hypothetical protein QFC22_000278 [Naganishia vaughanmartiniae]